VLRPEILSFSGSLKLRFSFTGKTQDFRAQHVFRSPEKLKISVLSTFFIHRKNSRFPGSARFSFTEKTQDFRAQHIFRSPEKLKNSVLWSNAH